MATGGTVSQCAPFKGRACCPPAGSARLPVLDHQGNVGRLHRQAVADLSMAVDGSDQKPPRFWKTGVPHAQLGLWPWRD
jgi:hypothetical protein